MCGIFGKFSTNGISKEILNSQVRSIHHRGPDDSGIWINSDETVAFGSTRLAIQDLSQNGHMPMISSDNNCVIAFNGEIYNYPQLRSELITKGYLFRTNTDTEVILNAYQHWGTEFLPKLNGMFAIAIFDQKNELIMISRDRAGEKPLYFSILPDGIIFGSELKIFFSDTHLNKKINYVAFENYLKFGYSTNNQSMISGISKLLPGSYLIFSLRNNSHTIKKYWDIPSHQDEELHSTEFYVNKLNNLLNDSVKRQLISDLPVGVLLSGGLDSSLIAAYAAENASGRIKTFNISFNGFGKYDESAYARIVSKHFNTEHIELTGNDLSFKDLDSILDSLDEPIADSSILPTYLLASLVKKHVTVALGGDGGDELFGGYTNYRTMLKISDFNKKIPPIFNSFLNKTALRMPDGLKGKNFLLNYTVSSYDSFLSEKYFSLNEIYNLITPEFRVNFLLKKQESIFTENIDPVYTATKHDFKNYLCDDILVKVDRASMAHSLELRAPWLDKELIEFAFKHVPSKFKVDKNQMKILPKILASRKLPSNLNLNRKQGFSIPISDWIKGKWKNEFEEELNLLPREIFNKNIIQNELKKSSLGFSNSHKLFALVIFSKWLRKYNVKF